MKYMNEKKQYETPFIRLSTAHFADFLIVSSMDKSQYFDDDGFGSDYGDEF